MRETMPQDWKDAAKDAMRCLSVATQIVSTRYQDANDVPEGLLPALVVALAVLRSSNKPGSTADGALANARGGEV